MSDNLKVKNSELKVKSSELETGKRTNMKTYIYDIIPEDIKKFQAGKNKKTGYSNLDVLTNLYSGLYVIGAISSLGKTTFIHQMSDQLAEAGEHVIFFSLEQNTLELASKSLSRILAKKNYGNARTSLQIRNNDIDDDVRVAIDAYGKFANNITVVEYGFKATVEKIEKEVKNFIKTRNIKPVVIVDYLQVIQSEDYRGSTKELVDMNVRKLKQLQSEEKIVVIVISSLNRQNYGNPINFESFKESGGIEYTADVVWGLQLEELHEKEYMKEPSATKKQEMLNKAKASIPRRIELICLKNRFGISSYCCKFNYFPQFDYFVPDNSDITDELLNASTNLDKDGFSAIPDGYISPFN